MIACGDLALEGLWHRGERGPAVLLCGPVGAGGMDAPPLAELAWACARAGHPTLRFQHRGVGASTGARDPDRALDDARAALDHLAQGAAAPGLAVAGVGSGCATAAALARAEPRLAAVVLVAPDRPPDVAGLAAPALVLLPGQGGLAPGAVGPGPRVEVLPEADALFLRGLPALARAAVAFLERAAARARP